MPSSPLLPWPARAANAVGDKLRELGTELVELDVARLKVAAVELARADDFGAPDFERGLYEIVASAERDADLSLIGRMGIRDAIVNALANRLLSVSFRRRHPELFRSELTPPVIVMGLPRSGTTLLHRLLALAPEARALRYWELRRPLAAPGVDPRAQGRGEQRAFKWLARGLDAKHFSNSEAPEECLYLFDSSLVSTTFWIAGPLYGYLAWYLEQDQSDPYRTYADYLRVFQAQAPDRRLTLKAPIHTGYVPELLAAIPGARLVQLHRDPRPAVASANSLFATLHRVVTNRLDLERLGRANLDLISRLLERSLDNRRHLPRGTILDVYYHELVADPLGTVRAIHERFDLPFPAEYEARLREFLRDNAQHKHGEHRYDARDFGLSDRAIARRFERYYAAFPSIQRAHAG